MPKLIIFAPCHKVLIDQDNNISLISIFQELRIPTAENIPSDAQAIIQWDTLAVWQQTPEDQGRTYEQDLMLIAPGGATVTNAKRQFTIPARQHRVVTKMYGFPVSLAGEYSLLLTLKDVNNDSALLVEASYPMFVFHEPKPLGTP